MSLVENTEIVESTETFYVIKIDDGFVASIEYVGEFALQVTCTDNLLNAVRFIFLHEHILKNARKHYPSAQFYSVEASFKAVPASAPYLDTPVSPT